MSFTTSNYLTLHLLQQSPSPSPQTRPFFHKPLQIRQFRVWRRRRRPKTDQNLAVSSFLGPSSSLPFENLFHTLISQFPSLNSLDFIAPALGAASGIALYLSRFNSNQNFQNSRRHIGEWILFTSPTPFNRFVLLRCPSISFEGSELLEDVNEKLAKEERHFVKLNSGRIRVDESLGEDGDGGDRCVDDLVYQRVCICTDDGGVVSLDWPANLDLTEERGMDTTLLLVPGTAEGSGDKNVRSFVCDSLRKGCFPVVMNPRGCAGSPLTTARLFTAADSDDVCTAIKFINKARPWTTLMGVGWGHGANMLTKYLAEVAERTPLTAVACIDNPFDLEEATRSFPYHIAVDQKLTSGLVEILRSNKELFQGRAKGFNVEKALSATSLRDFEKEISTVSYGFKAIEEFYSKSSTRELVGNVKIPLLFIQSDNGTVPPFSIPRSSIAENPFTSLVLCSCLQSRPSTSQRSLIYWCQHFAIEWLTAVELGLLKGRHPLLKDVDITINPSKGLSLAEGRESDDNSDVNKFLHLNELDAFKGDLVNPRKDGLNASDIAVNVPSQSWINLLENVESQKQEKTDMLFQASRVDAELFKEEEDSSVDNEESQVFQTAQVVMNMLDVTMPGALGEEQKKKVLTAVGLGETLVKALEGAVPEDVRGKLTASVSEILLAQGKNLTLDGIRRIGQNTNASPIEKLKIQEALGPSSATGENIDIQPPEHMQRGDQLPAGVDSNQSGMEKPAGGLESELQPSQVTQKSQDQSQTESESSHGASNATSGTKDSGESEQNPIKGEFLREKAAQIAGNDETVSGTECKPTKCCSADKEAGFEDVTVEQDGGNQSFGVVKNGKNELKDIHVVEEKSVDPSIEQNKLNSTIRTDESSSNATPSIEPSQVEKEGNDVQKGEDKSTQPTEGQNKENSTKPEESVPFILPASNSPSVSVSGALDALTNFDNSTQMAVNSVFGVLENMLAQFEEDNGHSDGNDKEVKGENEDEEDASVSEEASTTNEIEYKPDKEDSKNIPYMDSEPLQSNNHPVKDFSGEIRDPNQDGKNGYKERQLISSPGMGSTGIASGNTMNNHVKEEKPMMESLLSSKILVEGSNKFGGMHKFPLYITVNSYGDSLYSERPRRYFLSKISNTKPLDLDSTADLLLDYFPEEGQWKLLDQPGNTRDSVGNIEASKTVNDMGKLTNSLPHADGKDEAIEPSYVILDTENEWKPVEEYKTANNVIDKPVRRSVRMEELKHLVRNVIIESLKVEVGRRIGFDNMKKVDPNLSEDLEKVADAVAVAVAVGDCQDLSGPLESTATPLGKDGTLHGEHIIETISSAAKDATYLRNVLPIGVIVGSSLAAFRSYFNVLKQHENGNIEYSILNEANNVRKKLDHRVSEMEDGHGTNGKEGQSPDSDSSARKVGKLEKAKNGTVMVGAVTAALGASALLVHQQRKDLYECNQTPEVSSLPHNDKGTHHKEHHKFLDATAEKNQNNIVTSLAEKAMSVAGPVVPTNNDGGVDHERLVAMLADLGQKGGILRLVGKVALLWGGIRGALSLTDRLISFSRIAERPLYQRIFGFACMVLVLWSPVVIPLFPTLVQSWATQNSNGITKYACIMGLYTAVTILIMLWGKRIRGYKDPVEQYGLDLASLPKLLDFLKGLVGGVLLVFSIHSINVLLGHAHFSWPWAGPSSSPDVIALLKVYGGVMILACRGIVTATVVSIVEELLFRSWLPEEIAADLGYHRAVIISGLAFAILQRSLQAIPGLWVLSFVLSGIRQRNGGSLSMPIGIRAGILAFSFMLQTGGFLIYHPNSFIWLTGTHPLQPFGGVIGLAMCLALAILLYPRRHLQTTRVPRVIRE